MLLETNPWFGSGLGCSGLGMAVREQLFKQQNNCFGCFFAIFYSLLTTVYMAVFAQLSTVVLFFSLFLVVIAQFGIFNRLFVLSLEVSPNLTTI